jgi:hypothetical protein
MPLEFSVPTERIAPPKDLELRPKQARAWVATLPMTQVIDSARKLLENVTAMNRAKLDVEVRHELLEAYRPVVSVVLEELDAVYAKATLPMPPKARDAMLLARDLSGECATGYKQVALERTGKLISFGAKKHLPLLLLRIAEHLGNVLKVAYRSYTPNAPDLWKELHGLYLYAEKENMLLEAADPETKATIADAYIEALLLSLTDPYRLVPGEVDRVISLIRSSGTGLGLGVVIPPTNPGGHFVVPCDTDRPPKPMQSASNDPGGPNARLLDANPIVDKLRQKKNAMETGAVSSATSRMLSAEMQALINKLLVLWGDPPKRTFRRDAMEATVAVCAGIKALFHFVSLEEQADAARESEAIRGGITIPLIAVPEDEVSKALQVTEWDVVNQSAGGLKVRRIGQLNQAISVGEAIGVKFVGRPRWTVGVVRWLTLLEEEGMEFGIEFLAPAARSVTIQPTAATGGGQKLGLLIPEFDPMDASTSLLTPPLTFSDLREFEVEDRGELSLVRATQLLERTQRFELFHISASGSA